MNIFKKIIIGTLRFLMSPFRKSYIKRNGVNHNGSNKEIANEVLFNLTREYLEKGHTGTIPVKGYSMRPFLEHKRDKVELIKWDDIQVGDAILAEVKPNLFVLHRIIEIDGDNITLMGDGNLQGHEHCTRKDVIGKVINYIRPNRIIPADDPTLCRRIRLWRRLEPIRRFLLIFYKAVIE